MLQRPTSRFNRPEIVFAENKQFHDIAIRVGGTRKNPPSIPVPFFPVESVETYVPSVDLGAAAIKIRLRKFEARNGGRHSIERSQIFARGRGGRVNSREFARANVVFPRVCIFMVRCGKRICRRSNAIHRKEIVSTRFHRRSNFRSDFLTRNFQFDGFTFSL